MIHTIKAPIKRNPTPIDDAVRSCTHAGESGMAELTHVTHGAPPLDEGSVVEAVSR